MDNDKYPTLARTVLGMAFTRSVWVDKVRLSLERALGEYAKQKYAQAEFQTYKAARADTKSGKRRNVDDKLFAINLVAAKFRHDMSRMARRTWVTTKQIDRLQAHLDLYIAFNNGYKLTG